MHKIYLPIVTNYTFEPEKLSTILQKLWVDATMKPAIWHTISYDSNWTIGFYSTGNTVISSIYLESKKAIPTANQLIEVINNLPKDKYEYSIDSFYISGKRHYGILKEKGT